jgi:cytochrome c oxidase cbb3-type subunit 3
MIKSTRNVAIGSIAVVALLLAAIAGRWAYTAHMNHELLVADPDALSARRSLTHYAAAIATPAYAKNCAQCHGSNLKGNNKRGYPDLTDRDWIYGEGRVSEIELTITYGIRSHNPKARNYADMPGFAKAKPDERSQVSSLSPGQINDLTAYLVALSSHKPISGGAESGEMLFTNSGGCFDCHGGDAGGDNFIGAVNLQDNIWLYGDGSPDSIYASIADGHAGVCPAWINKLKPAVIRALAVYINTRSRPPGGGGAGGAS